MNRGYIVGSPLEAATRQHPQAARNCIFEKTRIALQEFQC